MDSIASRLRSAEAELENAWSMSASLESSKGEELDSIIGDALASVQEARALAEELEGEEQ